MNYDTTSRLGSEQLRALLGLSRELLQVDDAAGVLRFVGRAVSELTGAAIGLLIVRAEREHAIGFDHRGLPRSVASDHPLYRTAAGVFSGAWDAGGGPVHANRMLLLGVPGPAPVAAYAAGWDGLADERTWSERKQILQSIVELAVAAMGKVEARNSLEALVLAQYGQLADSATLQAAEQERRDLAEQETRILSLTDLLTGLNNRRGFFVHADHVFRVAQRRMQHSAVIFADVDGLKAVNEALGPEAGNSLIRDAAAVFRASFREADVVARLGGVAFVSYTLDDAHPDVILDRLENNLTTFNLMQQRPYRMAISAGIVRCDPYDELDLARYVLQADEQMVAHKRRRLH